VDGLKEAGYRVDLANTAAIKKYDSLKYSGDYTDAAQLAQLLRLGILPRGYVRPPELRTVRDLARRRIQLVRQWTTQILSIENVLSRQTGSRLKSDDAKRLTARGR
jgi:transposase